MSGHVRPVFDYLLVRHAESEANVDRQRYRDMPDENIPLTARGAQQAEATGQFLAHWFQEHPAEPGICMFVSSYTRARQTAQGIFNVLSRTGHILHVRETDLLAEQRPGLISGLTVEEWKDLHPAYYAEWQKNRSPGAIHHSPLPGGETRAQVELRGRLFLSTLHRYRAEHGGGPALIVSHGTTVRQLAKALLNLTREESDMQPTPDNAEVRLIRRPDARSPLLDYGPIWKNGAALPPVPRPRVKTTDLYKANTYAIKPD